MHWRKKLDVDSKASIDKGIEELIGQGFVKGRPKEIYYEPIYFFGTGAYTKRIATIIMMNGTKIVMLTIGPAVVFDPIPWLPYRVDILPKIKPPKLIKLYKEKIWHGSDGKHYDHSAKSTILGSWGKEDIAERRRRKIFKRMGKYYEKVTEYGLYWD